jgi:hypothetical protein
MPALDGAEGGAGAGAVGGGGVRSEGGTSTSGCCECGSVGGPAPGNQKGPLLRCVGVVKLALVLKFQRACVETGKVDLTGSELEAGVPRTLTECSEIMRGSADCGNRQHVSCHKAEFNDPGRGFCNKLIFKTKKELGGCVRVCFHALLPFLTPCCLFVRG